MQWQPRDIIAAILASVILAVVIFTGVSHMLGIPNIENTELIGAWRDLLLTLLGALAGYIGGGPRNPGP